MVSKTAAIVFAVAGMTLAASGAQAQQRLGDFAVTYINKYVKTKNGKIGNFDVNSLSSQPQTQAQAQTQTQPGSQTATQTSSWRKRMTSLGPK